MAIFCRIWGAGPSTAEQWYSQGHRSLTDLRTSAKLTSHQRVGLDLFDDLDERMSRQEAAEIEAVVASHAKTVGADVLEVTACGSYRRGKPTCGDLDVLVTPTTPGHSDDLQGVFDRLLESMRGSGFLTHDLTVQSSGSQQVINKIEA